MKYKYIVFDFNGTVLDDVELCYQSLNILLEERGYDKCESLDKYKHIFTFPIKDYYINAGFDFSRHSFESIATEFISYYQKRSFNCSIYEGVLPLINELKKEGIKVILLSASKYENLIEQCQILKIDNYFDDILGISNILAKSKSGIAKEYFKDIDSSEILFIGDSLHDEEVADSLGADCVLISYGHQARDVLEKGHSPVIDKISEVKKFL